MEWGYRSFHFKIITYLWSAVGLKQILSTLTSTANKSRKCAAVHFVLLYKMLQKNPSLHLLCVELLLASTLVCWLSLLCIPNWHRRRFCVEAVVWIMGPGRLPAVLMAPDCLCTGSMKQAQAVKRIIPALSYSGMVYHPVANYSYYI